MPDILKDYDKQKIVDLCEELQLNIDISTSKRELVNVLIYAIRKLDLNTLEKEEYKEHKKFLYLYSDSDKAYDKAQKKIVESGRRFPPCFGFADENDPSCKKCTEYDECLEIRIKTLPECFGILYDEKADECKICVEWSQCKKILERVL